MPLQFTFRRPKKKKKVQLRVKMEWKPPKLKNDYWKVKFNDSTMGWTKVKEVFAKAEVYYLDENGRSVPSEGNELTPYCAKYIFGRLEGYTTDESHQLYAWKGRRKDGSISAITFGSRFDFDKNVLNNLNQ